MTLPSARKWIIVALVATAIVLVVAKLLGSSWGDLWSLGQLAVDVMLLPAAVISFTMAAKEFREAQATPDIDLYWSGEDGGVAKELSLDFWRDGRSLFHLSPTILNKGPKVALWYTVRFTVPRSLAGPQGISGPVDQRRGWDPIVGGEDNWKIGEVLVNGAAEEYLFTFMGRGEIGALPGDGLMLATVSLPFPVAEQCPERIEVPYTIVTGWGQHVAGCLVLRLKRPAPLSNSLQSLE